MRENYWVDREITIEKISNQVTVYGISTTFLTEPEFKAKLKISTKRNRRNTYWRSSHIWRIPN
jgi:hypothetical protein